MTRTYICGNAHCPNFGIMQMVRGRPVGIFWELPHLICSCGRESMIIDALTVEGSRALGELTSGSKDRLP